MRVDFFVLIDGPVIECLPVFNFHIILAAFIEGQVTCRVEIVFVGFVLFLCLLIMIMDIFENPLDTLCILEVLIPVRIIFYIVQLLFFINLLIWIVLIEFRKVHICYCKRNTETFKFQTRSLIRYFFYFFEYLAILNEMLNIGSLKLNIFEDFWTDHSFTVLLVYCIHQGINNFIRILFFSYLLP